ncbi:hypothetical protein GTQ40_17165 [Flavobacteriaceae bacterium R38]|nr:hypothetical protein [Flavobacteriaceae bacterium R38]
MKTTITRILLFLLCTAGSVQLTAQSKCKDDVYAGREWTGKWNTSFGELVLIQRGSSVTGRYRNLGEVKAIYNKYTGKLKGTFTNKGSKGSFEFVLISCSNFRGKWGWGTALNKGDWSGKRASRNTTNRVTRTNTGSYKLKITLDYVKSSGTWDRDGKDDYMLHFLPTLKLDGRAQKMKYKKYGRIKNQIESYGPSSALHIRRTKGQKDHASVQVHLYKGHKMNIGNSGIFEIPKNYRITDSGTDFNIAIVADEVSSKTERIMTKNYKLDLKSILDFLTGKLYPGNRRDFMEVIPPSSSGLKGTQIQMRNNKRYVYNNEHGEKRLNRDDRSGLEVRYVIELVD